MFDKINFETKKTNPRTNIKFLDTDQETCPRRLKHVLSITIQLDSSISVCIFATVVNLVSTLCNRQFAYQQ